MSPRLTRLLFACALLVLSADAMAQDTRTVGGRTFTVHRVEAGQTLFAISRAYAVPVDALLAANPTAAEGLSIGQELLVPQDAVVKKEVRSAPVLLADGELRHTVQKKETLYGIARRYGVDMNAVLERNPSLVDGLREGMEVVIPMAKVTGQSEVATRPAQARTMVTHTVQPGETLYSLGQRYGVAPEVIQEANSGLPEGLKAGAVVQIPLPYGVEAPVADPVPAATPGQRYKVAFLLPFSTAKNDSALAAQGGEARFYEASRIAAQFYGGALIALDSLERGGLLADITVVDIGDGPAVWNNALKQPGLGDVDLFIGPFHRSAIEHLARVNSRAHIVCPVQQSNKVILGYPTVSKVTPTRTDLIRHTARYVALHHNRDHVLLLRPDIYADKEGQDLMGRSLHDALAAQPGGLRDSVLVARPGRRDLGDLPGKLRTDRLNVLVAPSDDVEYVTSLVSKLKSLAGKYRIALVGLESWLAMETVAATDLEPLGFLFASGTHADAMAPQVQAFTLAFRERFGNDVDEYAFRGYDVTLFYLSALMEHGPAFTQRFDQVHCAPLQMGFRMTRTGPENGFRNEYAVMLMQQGLGLVKAP